MQFHPLFVWGNVAEACLWIGLAVLALRRRVGQWSIGLAAALTLFGVSDLVETQTGAWYDPPWLLAWKAICVLALIVCGVGVLRAKRPYNTASGATASLQCSESEHCKDAVAPDAK